MAVKGVYTPAEQEMLDRFDRAAGQIAAGADDRTVHVTEETILINARWGDFWNPLWRDRQYAAATKWGSIIAPPCYEDCAGFSELYLCQPEGMYLYHRITGEDWNRFAPVRPGDTLRARHRRPTLTDVTGEDGIRRFRSVMNDCDIFNQNGLQVASCQTHVEYELLTQPRDVPDWHDHIYTKEAQDDIRDMIAGEFLRGGTPLGWDDITVGAILPANTMGAVNIWDAICFNTASQVRPFSPRRAFEHAADRGIMITDPATHVPHVIWERHYNNTVARICGEPRAFQFAQAIRPQFVRLLTNWAGDSAFVRSFSWKQNCPSYYGETEIITGEVTNKTRDSAGNILASVRLSAYNLARQTVSNTGCAVVELPGGPEA